MTRSSRRPFLESLGLHRPDLRAWAMYDWANSAFATTIMAAILPLYYPAVAAADLPGSTATAYWGYTAAIALAIVAVISPVLGAAADYLGARKKFVGAFMAFGVTFSGLLWFVSEGEWLLASALYIVANIGFAGANVFYESLLPSIASEEEVDRVSTAGYAIGYVGGGVLLAVNAGWILWPDRFGFGDMYAAMRASFVSVAVWWLVFSIPLFRTVKEPERRLDPGEAEGANPITTGFRRVWGTLQEIRGHRQVFLFLLAYWIYSDGVGTVIKMGAIYGEEIGIPLTTVIAALLVIQFVGIPFTFAFGALASRIGTKRGVYLALAIYTGIAIIGYTMEHAWQFWLLAVLVATAQGGVQGLSRSLFASMIPTGKSSEFFAFYSVSSKFAGILGPVVFGVVGQVMGSSRGGILALVAFFIGGMLLLTRVDVEEGRAAARRENREMTVAP